MLDSRYLEEGVGTFTMTKKDLYNKINEWQEKQWEC